ncbi:hypothetical protein NGM10_11385 [Halorussus salilacus]|uniref:hypothetical protein n=1 Tax=Halorussus salilacus TaxID=2953750 RepID=UPI0020A08680|nr:hypothetical protein [Halorussus salilacus]USZ67332.1 hypothetical protein NGM10_11385 [Halorussus salilacus]
MTEDNPIEGQVLVLTAAKASVGGKRLPDLVAEARRAVEPRADELRRSYECVHEDDVRVVFLAPEDFWVDVGEDLGWSRREYEAVARAHAEQLLRVGRREDRLAEFETALDLREAVVVGAGSLE